jgi:hypothetical protein
MRDEIERLLSAHLNDLVKLELALFFQRNPGCVDHVEGIARRVRRDPREVEGALCALADGGVLSRFELGGGKYVLYGFTSDPEMRSLLDSLSAAYHDDPSARVHIVKRLMGLGP